MLQQKRNLEQLQNSAEFLARHIGPSPDDQQQMLHALDCSNLQQLIEQVVPKSIATREPLPLQDSCTEVEALAELSHIAEQNKLYKNFIGQGYYCLLYTSPSPRDMRRSRMPSSA